MVMLTFPQCLIVLGAIGVVLVILAAVRGVLSASKQRGKG
jgi:hypothetical protein